MAQIFLARKFDQKSKVWSKIEILTRNRSEILVRFAFAQDQGLAENLISSRNFDQKYLGKLKFV